MSATRKARSSDAGRADSVGTGATSGGGSTSSLIGPPRGTPGEYPPGAPRGADGLALSAGEGTAGPVRPLAGVAGRRQVDRGDRARRGWRGAGEHAGGEQAERDREGHAEDADDQGSAVDPGPVEGRGVHGNGHGALLRTVASGERLPTCTS